MKVLGIANHGPEQLFSHLHKNYNICATQFTQVPIGGNLSLTTRLEKNIIFFTTHDFRRHIKYLNKSKFNNKRVFVLGSAQQLFPIEGLVPLDFKEVSSKRSLDLKLLTKFYALPDTDAPPVKGSLDFIDLLSEKVQNGSILNSLMTAIYTIPKTINQKAVTLGICEWFYENHNDEYLEDFLTRSRKKSSLSDSVHLRISEILKGDNAKNFRIAFAKLKTLREAGEEGNETLIGNQCDVPAFELRYISIKYKNENLYETEGKRSVDSLVDGKDK